MARETNIHAGHRASMRRKYLAVGEGAFHAHELVEILLYYSVPLCDTNPTAHRLIETLGGIDRVLKAESQELLSVKGIGETSARLVSLVRKVGIRAEKSLVDSTVTQACDYEEYLLSGAQDALYRLLLLDASGCVLSDLALNEYHAGADFDISREILKKSLHYRASSVVVIRRSDGRAPQPTAHELEMAVALRDALSLVDVRLADYVILSGERTLRFARAYPECVYSDPDVALTFRLPAHPDGKTSADESSLLCELLSYAKIRDEEQVRDLLVGFGGLGRLMSVPTGELIRAGLSEQAAVLLSLTLALYGRGEIAALSADARLDSAERQADYFARHYIGLRDERLSMLLLDRACKPLAFVSFADGGVGNTAVDLRKITELAIYHGASSVALAHNHPGGTPIPSSEDIHATIAVDSALASVGVLLDEHYVLVGRSFVPIRLYSDEMMTVRPPEFYGDASFSEIRRRNSATFSPQRRLGLRES